MSDEAWQGEYHPAIIPYLLVANAPALIAFFEQGFGGKCRFATPPVDGKTMHAEIEIGDSVVMVSDASEAPRHPVHLCHYVADADAVYESALAAGAISLSAPETKPYGDRVAGVEDPAGNVWWICTHGAPRLDT